MKPAQQPRYEFGKESTRVMEDELVRALAEQSKEGVDSPPGPEPTAAPVSAAPAPVEMAQPPPVETPQPAVAEMPQPPPAETPQPTVAEMPQPTTALPSPAQPSGEPLRPTTKVEVLANAEVGVVLEESAIVREIAAPPPATPTTTPGTALRAARFAGVIVFLGAMMMVGLGHHEPFQPSVAQSSASSTSVLGVFQFPDRMVAALGVFQAWLDARQAANLIKSEPPPVDTAEHGGRSRHHHHHHRG
jgi:hypothetical protein